MSKQTTTNEKVNPNPNPKPSGKPGKPSGKPGKPSGNPGKPGGNPGKPGSDKPSGDRGQTGFSTFTRGARTNDPNWYFNSKELADQCMNYSFETILGSEPVDGSEYIPYIAVIGLNPSPGTSYFCNEPGVESSSAVVPAAGDVVEGYDGANYMASRMFTMLSASSGRNAQYQASDILMSILANSSIIEAVESLRRIFGLAFLYSSYNRSVPRKIIEAMGIDFADFIDHVDDYREALNFEISRINQIPILSNIGFMRKSLELYQNVYYDEDSQYAQYFCYVPATVWTLDEQSYQNGSNLMTTPWMCVESAFGQTYQMLPVSTGTLIKMSTLISTLRTMISEVLNSTTLNLVYMDLLHLASKDSTVSFIKLDHILEGYSILPKLDKTASLQFHNLNDIDNTMFGTRPATGSTTITSAITGTSLVATPRNDVSSDPNTGRIVYNPCIRNDALNRTDAIVDFFEPNPSIEDRIEAQRYTIVRSNYHNTIASGSTQWSFLNVLPDHYPVFLVIEGGTSLSYDTTNKVMTVNTQAHFTVNNLYQYISWNGTTVDALRASYIGSSNLLMLTKFRNHPVVTYFDVATGARVGSLGNYSYYTKIPFYKMKRINQYVYAGLFEFR